MLKIIHQDIYARYFLECTGVYNECFTLINWRCVECFNKANKIKEINATIIISKHPDILGVMLLADVRGGKIPWICEVGRRQIIFVYRYERSEANYITIATKF